MSEAVNPKDLLGVKKAALHLVPPALAIWVSAVFKFSAKKYGPYNWREKPVVKSIYLDAIERHLLKMKDGDWTDPETMLPHIAHIGANAAILLDAQALGKLHDDMKWADGPAGALLYQLEEKHVRRPDNLERDSGSGVVPMVPKAMAMGVAPELGW